MEGWWFREHVVEPAEALLGTLAVGEEVPDLARCAGLALGIEGCFRSEVAAQHQGWPTGSTTDGVAIELCVRTGPRSLEAIGLMWIDFAGEVFPFRIVITTGAAATGPSAVGSIGQADPLTGSPPRFGPGTLVLPEREREGPRRPTARLIADRREVPIEWTQVFEVRSST